MNFRLLTDIDTDKLAGTTVLLRAEFNVPIKGGEIENDFRIRRVLPTILYLIERDARVVIVSHIWGDELTTLSVVADYLREHIPLTFVEHYIDGAARDVVGRMGDGEVVLFENLRLHDGERANTRAFAENLASYADIYVNEAFPVSHRRHASIVTLPKLLPSYAGLQFAQEVRHLRMAHNPPHPFLFILGGAKFETKIPLMRHFVDRADCIYVAGALCTPFLRAQGYEIGASLTPDQSLNIDSLLDSDSVTLPTDLVVAGPDGTAVKTIDNMYPDESQRDIGPRSLDTLVALAHEASFILWNGPLGDYEEGFDETTLALADELTGVDADTIIGGGDTVAVVTKQHDEDDYTFVSTAGGAMLDFLADATLPGIEALKVGRGGGNT